MIQDLTLATPERLAAARDNEEVIELILRVRVRVGRYSNAHGACAQLVLEKRDYSAPGIDRVVFVDADEIVGVVDDPTVPK